MKKKRLPGNKLEWAIAHFGVRSQYNVLYRDRHDPEHAWPGMTRQGGRAGAHSSAVTRPYDTASRVTTRSACTRNEQQLARARGLATGGVVIQWCISWKEGWPLCRDMACDTVPSALRYGAGGL